MAAEIEYYASDGITLITDKEWATMLAGTTTDPVKFYFKNIDVRTWLSVEVGIAAVGDNDGDEIVQIGATSGSLGTAPFNVGNVAPDAMVEFWQKLVPPGAMANAGNPRLWDISITETG